MLERLNGVRQKKIGCKDTYFITPNCLRMLPDENGNTSTTAEELAKIMRYCIKVSPQKELFLEITQAQNHTFTDVEEREKFSCNNHNAFFRG